MLRVKLSRETPHRSPPSPEPTDTTNASSCRLYTALSWVRILNTKHNKIAHPAWYDSAAVLSVYNWSVMGKYKYDIASNRRSTLESAEHISFGNTESYYSKAKRRHGEKLCTFSQYIHNGTFSRATIARRSIPHRKFQWENERVIFTCDPKYLFLTK